MLDVLQSADPVLYFLGLSAALKLSLYYRWAGRRPSQAEYVGQVQECLLYPLKSGRGVSTDKLICSFPEGPHNNGVTDRHWVVTTSEYDIINYKQTPKLSTLTPNIEQGNFSLEGSDGTKSPKINTKEVENGGAAVSIQAYGVTVRGLDCGDAPATWISDYLGLPGSRLVYAPPTTNTKRPVSGGNKKYAAWTKNVKEADMMAYQSVTPYHFVTTNTLEDINSRLKAPVGANRFRPNLIIKGDRPYSEDTWKEIFIGQTRFSTVKLTGRCVFTTIDPDTGVIGSDPLKTLNRYRNVVADPEFGPCVGIHTVLCCPGTIKPGDDVYVVRGDNTKP